MKTVNLNSERYYREACDYFYHFENTKCALLCVEKSLHITPWHSKSWFLKGEIRLMDHEVEGAIECFRKVEKYENTNARNLANIAVCYEMLEDYKNALRYCDRALERICEDDNDFLPSLYQLKISSLINLGQYCKAKKALKDFNSHLFLEDVRCLKMNLKSSIDSTLKVIYSKIAK